MDAVRQGDYAAVQKLLREGADPNYTTEEGLTLLVMAVFRNYGNITTLLLSNGASLDEATASLPEGNYGILHFAAKHDSVDAGAALVKGGAQVDALNNNGLGSLHISAGRGNVQMATSLLDNGASVDLASSSERYPLTFAILGNHLSMVRLLLSRGADVNKTSQEKQYTALHHAAIEPFGLIVQELLDSGAEIDAQTTSGFTPLHNAAMFGNQIGIEVLVINGANKTIKAYDITPLEDLCLCTSLNELSPICQVDACENPVRMKSLLS